MLGSAGLPSAFLGDGGWHTVGTGLSYRYASSGDYSKWLVNGNMRFAYTYSTGQWGDYGSSTWCLLGPTKISSAFLGDGNWHKLDSIWSYEFVNGVGYLEGSVSVPNFQGSWISSTTQQYRCDYTTSDYTEENLGLYDSSNTSSVVQYVGYTYMATGPYKWVDFNYDLSSKKEISQAIVYYSGVTTHDVSSWLNWLPVKPNPGFIAHTETWDFTNNDWANRYDHEVRAFANNMWVVQREQGDYLNSQIIAAIDSVEEDLINYTSYYQQGSSYAGHTQTWQDTVINWSACYTGLASSDPGTRAWWEMTLIFDMQQTLNLVAAGGWSAPGQPSWSDEGSLPQLLNYVRQVNAWSPYNSGWKAVLNIDLHYVPEFGSYASGTWQAVGLVGDTYINGQHYAEITNGWNIQSDTTTIAGYDPTHAYPITYIPFTELQNAYGSCAFGN